MTAQQNPWLMEHHEDFGPSPVRPLFRELESFIAAYRQGRDRAPRKLRGKAPADFGSRDLLVLCSIANALASRHGTRRKFASLIAAIDSFVPWVCGWHGWLQSDVFAAAGSIGLGDPVVYSGSTAA